MKHWTTSAVVLICLIAVGVFPGRTTTDSWPGLPAVGDSLLDLAPATALAAVEIRDLDRRWAEIRGIGALGAVQDIFLSDAGIQAGSVPALLGNRALFMLVPIRDVPFVLPVLLLKPHDRDQALRMLKRMRGVHYCDEQGVLWLGPVEAAGALEQIAHSGDSGLRSVLPLAEMDARVQAGGLARGYIQPRAWAELLGRLSERTNFELPRWVASWLQAELLTMRYVAFRRDISGGEIETEALAAYDLDRLPAEVARVFAPSRPQTPELPFLPAGAFVSVAFRPEADSWMPWLRYLAAQDPHGSLRNLGFQLDDFERRFRRDLRRDLCAGIGERGWLFLLEDENSNSASAVALVEARPSPALENTLADLLVWGGEQVWVDSLGAFFPRCWTRAENGFTIHGLELWTPLGRRSSLVFALTGRYLVLAGNETALRTGLSYAGNLPNLATLAGSGAHAGVRIQGDALSRIIDPWLALAGRVDGRWMYAATRLLADFQGAHMDMRYEPDAVRFEGRAQFR